MPDQTYLICNERFLARFGVDRILVLLAERLKAEGMNPGFVCLRADRTVLRRISPSVTQLSIPEGLDPVAADIHVARQMIEAWNTHPSSKPDVLIIGGWPFFSIAARADAHGVHSIFIDAGAVPHDGFPEFALPTQREIRRLRQLTLPVVGTVLPISDFIRETQTLPDRGNDRNVETILLGGDHLATATFDIGTESPAERAILAKLDGLVSSGTTIILSLGRYESFGYKNSVEIFDVFGALIAGEHDALHLVILAGDETVDVPRLLDDRVTLLPTIGDRALLGVMERSTLGLAVTQWEGFNLPIAEMQWIDRPVLAYAVGAHPEVIADPWFLCASRAEMISKAASILSGAMPSSIATSQRFDQFRDRFHWSDVLDRWVRAIHASVSPSKIRVAIKARRLVLIDVSNSARDPANSGVIRVTRRLSAELVRREDMDVVFVIWNASTKTYHTLGPENQPFLSSNAGPLDWLGLTSGRVGAPVSADTVLRAEDPLATAAPILFLPEVILDDGAGDRIDWAESRGLDSAAIFYDMLPVFEAYHVASAVSAAFPSYVAALARTKGIYAISRFSLDELRRYCDLAHIRLHGRQEAIWLPGQFSDLPRAAFAKRTAGSDIRILCVSTIEPRKNHVTLVAAFRELRARRPDLPVTLVLVGNSYAGGSDMSEWLRRQCEDEVHIVWHGVVSDAVLAEQYRAASFTVYPSLAEGFGLPIMESLWLGVPCLCNNVGVMAELAAAGGCMTVDMTDSHTVSLALERFAEDDALCEALGKMAADRTIDTWLRYADEIGNKLAGL